jgi:hypothetical protein
MLDACKALRDQAREYELLAAWHGERAPLSRESTIWAVGFTVVAIPDRRKARTPGAPPACPSLLVAYVVMREASPRWWGGAGEENGEAEPPVSPCRCASRYPVMSPLFPLAALTHVPFLAV